MKDKIKILEICEKIPITQHTFYAMPLSIVLSNTLFRDWVYQHFVQVYSSPINGPTIKLRMYYYDRDYAFSELLNMENVEQFEKIGDIIKFVIECIKNKTYVIFYIDTYFVKEKYRGKHRSEKVLIHGYDLNKNIFYAKGYNSNLVFTTYIIAFDELRDSFAYYTQENDSHLEPFSMQLIELKERQGQELFSVEKYKEQLGNYLNSTNEKTEFLQANRSLDELQSFGVKAYQDYEEYIERAMINGYRVPYHDFHLFHEHRKLNLERFEYINLAFGRNLNLEEYYDVTKQCESLRLSYMRDAIRKGGLYKPIYDKDIMLGYRDWMKQINQKEEEVLLKIIEKL